MYGDVLALQELRIKPSHHGYIHAFVLGSLATSMLSYVLT